MKQTLVIYNYHTPAEDNLRFFHKEGCHQDNYYVFVFNDIKNPFKEIYDCDNILTTYTSKLNEIDVVKHVFDIIKDSFKYTVYIDCQILGPFIPKYFEDNWTTILTERLNDKVILVSPKIFRLKDDIYINKKIFATETDFLETLCDNLTSFDNIAMFVLKQGFKIDCLLNVFENFDWSEDNKMNWPDENDFKWVTPINPFETVFLEDCLVGRKYRSWALDNNYVDIDGFQFYHDLDSPGEDICCVGMKPIEELKKICLEMKDCIAFNTYGFMKKKILPESQFKKITYHTNNSMEGLYVNWSKIDQLNKKKTSYQGFDGYTFFRGKDLRNVREVYNRGKLDHLKMISDRHEVVIGFNTDLFIKVGIFSKEMLKDIGDNDKGVYIKNKFII